MNKRRSTTTGPKRGNAPKVARRRKASAADTDEKIALLERRLNEALEQQTATSEVLKVISSSPGELEPVFQTMLANAVRICEANFGMLFRIKDGSVRAAAMNGVPPAFAEFWQRGAQRPGSRTALGRVVETKQTIPCGQNIGLRLVPTQNSENQRNPGVSPAFRVLSRDREYCAAACGFRETPPAANCPRRSRVHLGNVG